MFVLFLIQKSPRILVCQHLNACQVGAAHGRRSKQPHCVCPLKSVPCVADKLAEEVCEAERKDAERGKFLASSAASSSDQESGDARRHVFLSSVYGNALEAVQQELKSCCPAYFPGLPLFACKMALGNVHFLKKNETIYLTGSLPDVLKDISQPLHTFV